MTTDGRTDGQRTGARVELRFAAKNEKNMGVKTIVFHTQTKVTESGRTWGSPPCSRRTLSKKGVRV